jgi:S-methylmethionine-dependent homocysteine/selenocysteine methylase
MGFAVMNRANGWLERLRLGDVVLLDGGTGSELRRLGFRVDTADWGARAALEAPELLQGIHRAYVEAGAEILTTHTFAATRFVLEAAGLAHEQPRIVTAAIRAAQRAREQSAAEGVAVAGSISCLPPGFDAGAYPVESREKAAYRELAERLASGGVDLLALEMMEHPRHAAWALEAAMATGLPVLLGMSVRQDLRGQLVAFDDDAVPFESLLAALLPAKPAAVAVMHTPPGAAELAIPMLAERWRGPLGVYPELEEVGSSLTPEAFAAGARRWVAAGARLFGGCCGATPAHIRALRDAATSLLQERR